MEELFQGGLQSMIKNVNNLAPVFAGGCNLTGTRPPFPCLLPTDEFRTCAQNLLTGKTGCVVSSCMIQAGDGICNQPDPAKAIDENLSCVFGQVTAASRYSISRFQIQEPTFAKCVRTTLSTVKQFTLSSFRNILPKFVDCTEELVRAKCGESPIRVGSFLLFPQIWFRYSVPCPLRISVPLAPLRLSLSTPSASRPESSHSLQSVPTRNGLPTRSVLVPSIPATECSPFPS